MTVITHQELSQTAPAAEAVLPFISDCHRNALEQLGKAFVEARPLAILIGEGKSTASFVIRSFLDGIAGDVAVARVTEAFSDGNAAMREIIRAIGADPKDMNFLELEDVFTMFLSLQMVRHRRTIICIEEAQDNGPWVFDMVHRLIKLETEGKYGLMVILSGRPNLNEMLQEPPLNALAAEAAERITLAPFTPADTKEYVRRRNEAAGNLGIGHLFEFDAIALIHERSEGVPDAVVNLYSKCLQLADEENKAAVTTDVVKQADELLRQGRMPQRSDAEAGSKEGNGASRTRSRLIARMNGELVKAHVLKQGHILIGRGKLCDIRLVPHEVSRHHAVVVNSPVGVDLVDLRSTNGTFVGGRPIKHYPLRDRDVIAIGGCMIEYVAGDDRKASIRDAKPTETLEPHSADAGSHL